LIVNRPVLLTATVKCWPAVFVAITCPGSGQVTLPRAADHDEESGHCSMPVRRIR
jgi:hypothetical protein